VSFLQAHEGVVLADTAEGMDFAVVLYGICTEKRLYIPSWAKHLASLTAIKEIIDFL
jgi:hypothetical protein